MNALSSSFDPSTRDSRAFRDALGRFGTGVTVVTCATRAGPLGITANSFASVSLDPPLVLWSPAKSSTRYPFFMAADNFAVHVMGAEQAHICSGFARRGDAFDGLDWETGPNGVPLINNCLSRFECTQHAVHDGGDHSIVVARVTRVSTRAGTPLLFFGGQYGGFTEPS
ncbi:flavin reductase family protein [Thalassococcus sp. CAU 1522]|uniref:Flavin reductase family protein n=1 Tax=Thalassococcus arenae TaxID=2851652 RepID=A0ABS6N7A5_9RHOB|nr:flavin reductase family protein [Thalassococcus arenae]MBV2359902.1 flavin reductase family protein [Thalassococcus arenae]